MATEPRYYPEYITTERTSPSWRAWLVTYEMSGEPEASELSTITDVCASARVYAKLFNHFGAHVGMVSDEGRVCLIGGNRADV
jgi:hypothetical protein